MPFSLILSRACPPCVTLLGVAVIVFVLIRVVPGNPIAMMLPPGATEDDIAALRALYGLDKPIWQQFVIWVRRCCRAISAPRSRMRQQVLDLVLGRLPATLELADHGAGHRRAPGRRRSR